MKRGLCIIFILALISCKPNNKGFTITGLTSNFPDSTKIYLRNSSTSQICDSTMIFNNKFHFKGIVDSIEPYIVHTKNFQDYKMLWIDNSNITLDASKSRLRTGMISGSQFQELNSHYQERENYLKTEIDSINLSIRITDKSDSVKLEELHKTKDTLLSKRQNAIIDFMETNPDFYLSSYYITFLMYNQPKQVTEKMFNALTETSHESFWGKAISTFLKKSIDLRIGDQAIDFTLSDIKGNQISLSSFKNKYVLLEFWASSCGPCRQENPSLLKAYRKYRNEGFEILGVSLDEQKSVWKSTILSDSILWTTVSDLKGYLGEIPVTYKIYYIPKNYLIDPQGKIIDIDLRGPSLEDKLKTIFGK